MCGQVQLQREIEKWGERYENDIEEQEQTLESLKKSRAEDLVKLHDYTERYEKEMAEKTKREEEARFSCCCGGAVVVAALLLLWWW